MRSLIIGDGEIGRSLKEVLEDTYPVQIRDVADPGPIDKPDVLHICFPYGQAFVNWVYDYVAMYHPQWVVIHSTVPPGTTDQINQVGGRPICVHSPVIGRHPDIAKALRVFKKMVGGPQWASNQALKYFDGAGLKTEYLGPAVNTELAKILDTTYYGLALVWHQEMARIAEAVGANFDALRDYNRVYNAGYRELGIEVERPVLDAMQFKGHCIGPNLEILRKQYDSSLLRAMEESNIEFGDRDLSTTISH